ncbi:MAG: replication-associated recombination protein A [Nitrospiraceae bacterium]|nr:replication-associated recombination protein A [Nitrospiraceae bacterium]
MASKKQSHVQSLNAFESSAQSPLAWRMRPRTLEEFVGQEHILGPGKLLRRAIEADRFMSLILYGPPGCGKTALAHIIAERSRAHFVSLNAVTAGVADIRRIVQEAAEERTQREKRTVVFIDEIHRFTRVQQDALLPDVERGMITLIGASTQNPFFAIIPALSSRSQIFEFKPLRSEDIRLIIDHALADTDRGLGGRNITVTDEAKEFLVARSGGDGRRSLNALELAVLSTPAGPDGSTIIDLAVAEESIQRKALTYDEDEHYDTISAFIKSMRGSDPDAAVYWLAKMASAGEDPLFIARRIVIAASEDVGNADPRALMIATAAYQAVERIGMPEGIIPLGQAAVYVAAAPKSNASYLAIKEAMREIEQGQVMPVPDHLKDASYKGAARLGRGKGYRYPHDYPGHHVQQEYLPQRRVFYRPTEQGEEKRIKDRLAGLKK